MAKGKKPDPKSEALSQENGVPQSQSRSGARRLVYRNPFFDAKDLVQVRYEMVRRHQIEALQSAMLPRRSASPGRPSTRPRTRCRRLACWSAAEQTRSQERPQDLHRGGLAFVADLKTATRSDDFAMCRCDRNAFGIRCTGAAWNGAGAAKKNESSNLIVAPSDTTDATRRLRRRGIARRGRACPGLGILHHRGVAEWIRALGQGAPCRGSLLR